MKHEPINRLAPLLKHVASVLAYPCLVGIVITPLKPRNVGSELLVGMACLGPS